MFGIEIDLIVFVENLKTLSLQAIDLSLAVGLKQKFMNGKRLDGIQVESFKSYKERQFL